MRHCKLVIDNNIIFAFDKLLRNLDIPSFFSQGIVLFPIVSRLSPRSL